MISNEREFAKECKNRGFARLAPRFYARCIGDGIYQTIYTGFKKYIDPQSNNYSPECRKSYYISISLRSVYSRHEESIFIPGKDCGGFHPADFQNKCHYRGIFNGIEEEYHIMETCGFNLLDSIRTQESLLEWWDLVQTIDTGHRIDNLDLVEPFLLCRNLHEAKHEISVHFIQSISAYRHNRAYIDNEASSHSYEQRIWQGTVHDLNLWDLCMRQNCDEINRYLDANYCRNIAWIEKYGIPISSDHTQRVFL